MNDPIAPRVFVSYSHDSDQHKNWVEQLAARLVANGVDAMLDQWDLTLGSDLPRFMEHGLTSAERVLCICTERYVEKANAGQGGTGYEKMILTAQLMQNVASDRIVAVVRDNTETVPVPTFLSSKLYVDFRNDLLYEAKYAELLRDFHGQKIKPRPKLGPNPFANTSPDSPPNLGFSREKYTSPAIAETVTFDYSNNNGHYLFGSGDMSFETMWTGSGSGSIHAYSDPPNIRWIALALDATQIADVSDAEAYDNSSRARTARVGEIVLWKNTAGYYMATQIIAVSSRSHGSAKDSMTLRYAIDSTKSGSFHS